MGRIEGTKQMCQSIQEHEKRLHSLTQKEDKTVLWAPSKSWSYGQGTSYNCKGGPTYSIPNVFQSPVVTPIGQIQTESKD